MSSTSRRALLIAVAAIVAGFSISSTAPGWAAITFTALAAGIMTLCVTAPGDNRLGASAFFGMVALAFVLSLMNNPFGHMLVIALLATAVQHALSSLLGWRDA